MKHVALLRGINVGGNRKIPMRELKATFERLGHSGVQTYIQSGNVIFQAEEVDVEAIQQAIRTDFGFDVPVILRRADEWASLRGRNPYLTQAEADGTKVHVAFLNMEPQPDHLQTIRAKPGNEWQAGGQDIFFHLPGGMAASELNLGRLKEATLRNWRTVQQIAALLSE